MDMSNNNNKKKKIGLLQWMEAKWQAGKYKQKWNKEGGVGVQMGHSYGESDNSEGLSVLSTLTDNYRQLNDGDTYMNWAICECDPPLPFLSFFLPLFDSTCNCFSVCSGIFQCASLSLPRPLTLTPHLHFNDYINMADFIYLINLIL